MPEVQQSEAMIAAVDLGAGSGRVATVHFARDAIALEVHERFGYGPRDVDGHLRWDFAALVAGVRRGLARAAAHARERGAELASVGVDSWGVDYGWLDARGELLADPIAYRDARTNGALARLFARIPREEVHARTGIQFMSINTLVQLLVEREAAARPRGAERLLLIPDLVHHALCGSTACERSDASTTQLLNLRSRNWDAELCTQVGLERAVLPELVECGTILGVLRAELARELGLGGLRVIAPATHDTASAVLGTPLEEDWAYISSGTWSLVGVELDQPVIGAHVLEANFTNEGGAFGTTRFLKNVMGLWILESLRREWEADGAALSHDELSRRLDLGEWSESLIDPDDERFLNPASMRGAIDSYLRETGQVSPTDPIAVAKLVLESLACRYAEVLDQLERLTERRIRGIHVVGGGSRNDFLNQRTADASRRTLRAGPVEATALGNASAQAIALGRFADVASARAFIARAQPPRPFTPRSSRAGERARARFEALCARRRPSPPRS